MYRDRSLVAACCMLILASAGLAAAEKPGRSDLPNGPSERAAKAGVTVRASRTVSRPVDPRAGGTVCTVDEDCDDGSPCTDDACVDEVCAYTFNTAPCDDGNACTEDDTCFEGSCSGADLDCDDGVACTVDSCDPATGCAQMPDDALCDDGMLCTGEETCDPELGCQPGTPIEGCCKSDADCDDGNICNGVESCVDNTCVMGTPLDCDDGVGCTVDTCDPVTGCAQVPDDALCDDGDACTGVETCDAELDCQGGEPVDCADLDGVCTVGVCDPADGSCTAEPANEGGMCDDGDICTENDVCTNGVCAGTAKDCSHLDDGCDVGVCNTEGMCEVQVLDDGAACDDGNLCTENDTCLDGVCGGTDVDCDDDITCTIDSCNPDDGCVHDDTNCLGKFSINLNTEDDCDSADGCYRSGADFCVSVDISELADQPIVGAQFFLDYDRTLLEVVAIGPGDHEAPGLEICDTPGVSPFIVPIYQCIQDDPFNCTDDICGDMGYAVGIPFGQPGTMMNSTLATIRFRVLGDAADGFASIGLTADCDGPPDPAPFTQLVDAQGNTRFTDPTISEGYDYTTDVTLPTFVDCEDYEPLCNDEGECGRNVSLTCSAFDTGCGSSDNLLSLEGQRDDGLPLGDPYPVGTTCITWTATDNACNVATTVQCITVEDCENPIASCPADQTVSTDEGRCDAAFTPPAATCEDNCGCEVNCVRADGLALSDPYPLGTTVITCTASDEAGLEDTCSYAVTVTDDEAPSITCSDDISVANDPGECGAVVAYDDCMVSDNCPGVRWSCDKPSGSFFPVGTTTVTCTATDGAGTTSSYSFDVTVLDEEAPSITCIEDVEVGNDPGRCDAVLPEPDISCSDNCDCTWACERSDGLTGGDPFPVGTTTVTCTATDPAGNTDSCSYEVTVLDTEAPTIDCPADIMASNDPGSCEATVTPVIPSCSDNCDCTVTCERADGEALDAPYPVGTTAITCTAKDPSNNSASCSYDVVVEDDERPTITCPEDIEIENDPGMCGAFLVPPLPVVADNCSDAADIQIMCTLPTDNVFPVGVTPVMCTATDEAGNTRGCLFEVTVLDTEPPLAIGPAGPIVVPTDPDACCATVNYMSDADDNCAGVDVLCDPPSGSCFPVGTTRVTCTATDASGNMDEHNFEIRVDDGEDPTIDCSPDITVNNDPGECGAIVEYDDCVADDNCEGASCSCDPPSGSFFPVGTTTVTCTAMDAAGRSSTCSFDVTVLDNESPVTPMQADIEVDNDPGLCSAAVEIPEFTCMDNCDVCAWACTRDDGEALDAPYPVGSTLVSCSTEDGPGNPAMFAFSVIVRDVESPVITCPDDMEVENDPERCDAVVSYPDPAVSDNCGAEWICEPASGSTFPVGTTTVTCTAQDAAGNADECAFDITVKDTEVPLVVACPGNGSKPNDPGMCGAEFACSLPECSDNCVSVTPSCEPSGFLPVGSTTVTHCCTDDAGLVTCCESTATIVDAEYPTITCPGNVTQHADAGECRALVTYDDPEIDDNCALPAEPWSCDPPSGSYFDVGTTQVTCSVTDAAGNTSSCSFDVEVLPTSKLDVAVRLEGVLTNVDRCISFGGCDGGPENEVMSFTAGLAMHEIEVPSLSSCICLKDELHTLGRCVPLTDTGTTFAADFTEDDSLLCGDADNDNLVDINDYGRLFACYLDFIDPDTSCEDVPPPPFHCDFTGDGIANAVDFTCIVTNFLLQGDDMTGCCTDPCEPIDGGGDGVAARPAGGDRTPGLPAHLNASSRAMRSIDRDRLAAKVGGAAALAADADGNGVVDARDVALVAESNGIVLPERFKRIMESDAAPAGVGSAVER